MKIFGAGCLAVLFLAHASCAEDPANSTPEEETSRDLDELRGIVIHKRATKSAESWNAARAEYYVLNVGAARVKHRSAKEGVLLLPTDRVADADFDRHVGRKVVVKGTYVSARPYREVFGKELDPRTSYPLDSVTGEPLPLGAGFQVREIAETD